jgi:hypothetical protein
MNIVNQQHQARRHYAPYWRAEETSRDSPAPIAISAPASKLFKPQPRAFSQSHILRIIMTSNTNPFRQAANGMKSPFEWSGPSKTQGFADNDDSVSPKNTASPFARVRISSTDAEPKSFPDDLPYRISQRSPWARLWHNNSFRIVTGVFCFLVVIGGIVAGAFFLANVMRTGIFHPGSGASTRNATRTVHITSTRVVPGMGKEMGPVTETMWSMQETRIRTQWIEVDLKTTFVPKVPAAPTTKS